MLWTICWIKIEFVQHQSVEENGNKLSRIFLINPKNKLSTSLGFLDQIKVSEIQNLSSTVSLFSP